MADTMQGLKRTHYCGEVTEAAIGSEVVVSGLGTAGTQPGKSDLY